MEKYNAAEAARFPNRAQSATSDRRNARSVESNVSSGLIIGCSVCADVLQLNENNNQGIRRFVSPLLLRLGRDKPCYNLVKLDTFGRGREDDGSEPSMSNIQDEDPFEPVVKFVRVCETMRLTWLATLTLLKIRLLLDLKAFHRCCTTSGPHEPHTFLSDTVLQKAGPLTAAPDAQLQMIEQALKHVKNV